MNNSDVLFLGRIKGMRSTLRGLIDGLPPERSKRTRRWARVAEWVLRQFEASVRKDIDNGL